MIKIRQKGNFSKAFSFFNKLKNYDFTAQLDRCGKEGVAALSAATPKDTGLTSQSWEYNVKTTKNTASVSFSNTNIQNGVPIAIILQYGHATSSGYWIEGIDYINPALKPVFEKIADEIWEEVKKV